MNSKMVSERGQALVIIALAIIGLVGITGLAIDGSSVLADRRHAQNAADTASLAGAVAYIKECKALGNLAGCDTASKITQAEAVMSNEARNRAIDNGYTGDLISSEIDVNHPPVSGPYANDTKYVQVVIHSTVTTTFARILGIPELHNRVEAVALLQEETKDSIFGDNALVELKPTSSDCSGDFTFGGSAVVTLDGGGVLVNSDNDTCAFECDGSGTSGTLNIINGGGISIVGSPGYTLDKCSGGVNASYITSGVDPSPFPPEFAPERPPECSSSPAKPVPDPADPTNKVTLFPGTYTQLPPVGTYGGINLNGFETYTLSPGNYCVTKVLKDAGNDTVIKGTDVFIYITSGGDFDINGGAVQISAPSDPDNPYYGYLIYVDPGPIDPITGTYSGNPATCTIVGNGNHLFTGAIYAPYCVVNIAGYSGPQGIHAAIIGYELHLAGNNTLYFTYDASIMPQVYTPPATGIAH